MKRENLSTFILSKRGGLYWEGVFDMIQSLVGVFAICFIVLNVCFEFIETSLCVNAIFGCLLCVNWIVFSWREWTADQREISRLPADCKQAICLPRWVNLFHYMYPLFLFVPICAVILGQYVFLELNTSFHCLWFSFLSVLMSFIITEKYDAHNEEIVEHYGLAFASEKGMYHG